MIFDWLKQRRRQRLLEQPFPNEWSTLLQHNVAFYRRLGEHEREKLHDYLRVFVAEKNWEGCGGLVMSDEIKVTIASQVCLLVFGFDNEFFDNVLSILVYPDAYVAPNRTVVESGVVLEGQSNREGEAWYRGPVILSWSDALAGARGVSGCHNLVLHEFAHQLDMQNGRVVDGAPALANRDEQLRWRKVMESEYRQHVDECERGHRTLLDDYGATNIAEFFAVATECFFQRPRAVLHRHPRLYAILRDLYRQDPAARPA